MNNLFESRQKTNGLEAIPHNEQNISKQHHSIDETSVLEGFCGVCVVDIPLRAKHCKYCNKCIATYDHHCDWVGNCIGEKNKLMFIAFVFNHCVELLFSILIVQIVKYRV
jgi:palmitoyltransferase